MSISAVLAGARCYAWAQARPGLQEHVATPPSRHHPGLTHRNVPIWPCLPVAPGCSSPCCVRAWLAPAPCHLASSLWGLQIWFRVLAHCINHTQISARYHPETLCPQDPQNQIETSQVVPNKKKRSKHHKIKSQKPQGFPSGEEVQTVGIGRLQNHIFFSLLAPRSVQCSIWRLGRTCNLQ